jgi:hypothetical protein
VQPTELFVKKNIIAKTKCAAHRDICRKKISLPQNKGAAHRNICRKNIIAKQKVQRTKIFVEKKYHSKKKRCSAPKYL